MEKKGEKDIHLHWFDFEAAKRSLEGEKSSVSEMSHFGSPQSGE